MKFKLRPVPLILSIVLSSVLLFGGWFVYNSMALNNPLASIVNNISGVEQANTEVLRHDVIVKINLKQEASLREVVQEIKEKGSSIIEQRQLRVIVTNESSPQLEQWWSTALFDVAEAMENKQYSNIPQALEARKNGLAGLHVETEMDNHYVYVKLVHNEYSKFIMLPRKAGTLGVW